MLSLGIDIGGSKIEVVVLDAEGNELYKKRYPTVKDSYEAFCDAIIRIIHEARDVLSQPLSIGICLPGTVEASNGKIKNSNILVLNQQSFPEMLKKSCGQPVAISNDANCFTLSEAIDGGGKGYSVVFGATLGTGCGGGVTINQQIVDGRNRCAGEWGHNGLPRYMVETDGVPVACYCGQINCIETFVSGTGLAQRYNLRFKQNLNTHQIVAAFEQKDTSACQQIALFQDQLARSLASVVNIIDPDVIVLGGGLSNSTSLFENLEEKVSRYIFSNTFTTPIVQAVYGDASGVRGAAWLGQRLSL